MQHIGYQSHFFLKSLFINFKLPDIKYQNHRISTEMIGRICLLIITPPPNAKLSELREICCSTDTKVFCLFRDCIHVFFRTIFSDCDPS
jgi:hypothetical protein